ncbi:VPLPA-CTERM sorting domain-containing protein [uncultured Roseobacter sp.]|uniref:VPLPA-CTERM sorting domain-containing protein n=1 Tax=uncultured Roseobacter sp. TaxID=114847 RepID=UPI00262B1D65|nr:VPLPA-CTERM sorting domain-containing protein [uncultured Roseobacter sp.]
MTNRLACGTGAAALLLALATPVTAKTISFSAALESANYDGQPNPFSEHPVRLDIVLELDETADPILQQNHPEGGSSTSHGNAINALTYEAFGVGGGSLGLWSVGALYFGISDRPAENTDRIAIYSTDIGGPAPLDTFLLVFRGDNSVFSGSDLGVLTPATFGAMALGNVQLLSDVTNGGMNLFYQIDFSSIGIADDLPIGPGQPAAVPLPAGMSLMLVGLSALGVVRSARRGRPAPTGPT